MSSWQPDRQSEILLKAAICSGSEVERSWLEWLENNDINNVNKGVRNLLPMVYQNLLDHGVTSFPHQEKLKGIFRKSWYRNQMQMRKLSDLVMFLNKNRIKIMVIKGAALILLYYKNFALRPMEDIDFLVSWCQALKCNSLLLSNGWGYKLAPGPQNLNYKYLVLHNSLSFRDKTGYHFDLHWSLNTHFSFPKADKKVWSRVKKINYEEVELLVPGPEDLLLSILEHGAHWNHVLPIRWLPDVLQLLGQEKQLDLEYFKHQVKQRNLVLPIIEMLQYLKEKFNLKILAGLTEDLKQSDKTAFDYQLYKMIISRKTGMIGALRNYSLLKLNYKVYCREHLKTPVKTGFILYIKFLMFLWDQKHPFLLPFLLIRNLFKKIF